MTAQEIIAARAPSLAAANSARLPGLISLAAGRTSARLFNGRTQEAIALLVLHWLIIDSRGGSSGPVVSETEGRLSRSYAAPEQGNGDLGTTSYGHELLSLGRAHGAGMPFNRRMA